MRPARIIVLLLIAVGAIAGCNPNNSIGTEPTITPTPNVLSGQYAFVLTGYDSAYAGSGNPLSMAGSFKADGLGNITGGAVDVNDNGVHSSSSALAGTYTIDDNLQGIITLTNTVSGIANPLKFGFSLQASGAFGGIIDVDANNFVAAGSLQQQNPAVFSQAALAGDYIFAMHGRYNFLPTSALGRFTLSAAGTSTNVAFDRSISGLGTAGPTTNPLANVIFSAPDTNGRGNLAVSIDDDVQGNTSQTFTYYVITASRFVAVETDTNGTMSGDASGQSTPFTAATVNTTGSIFGMAGFDTIANNEISAVGQLQIANQTAGTLGWDSNDDGGIVTIPTLAGQSVAFDPITGRGTISGITSGTANGLSNSLVFYLTAPGDGFLMDATPGVANRAAAGTLAAQVGSSFSIATDLTSSLAIVRASGVSLSNAQAFVGLFGPANGASTYAFLADQRVAGTAPETAVTISNVAIAGLNAITGRGTAVIPNGTSTETLAFYVVGPNQFVFIDISPVGSGFNGASSLFFASPH